MLLAATRVFRQDIRDLPFTPHEPAGPLVQLQLFEEVFVFEDEEAPGRGCGGGEARVGGFVVFQDDAGGADGVGLGGEEA